MLPKYNCKLSGVLLYTVYLTLDILLLLLPNLDTFVNNG